MNKILERLPQVIERTGLSRSTIYLLMERQDFPSSIKLSERAVAWDSEAIDQWIDARIKKSDAA